MRNHIMIIEFKNVSKTYQPGNEHALRDVSFSVHPGEFVCLVGRSGEGKSTILKLIAGLERPDRGAITRPEKISMAFQTVALFPWLTVLQNIMLALKAE